MCLYLTHNQTIKPAKLNLPAKQKFIKLELVAFYFDLVELILHGYMMMMIGCTSLSPSLLIDDNGWMVAISSSAAAAAADVEDIYLHIFLLRKKKIKLVGKNHFFCTSFFSFVCCMIDDNHISIETLIRFVLHHTMMMYRKKISFSDIDFQYGLHSKKKF